MTRSSLGIRQSCSWGALAAAVFVCAIAPAQAQAQDAPLNVPAGNAPFPPFKMADNLYYVGGDDWTSYLIVTKAGLIVIDGGDAKVGKQVVGNIRTLGFDPANVKILLNTHEHFDHAAGLAEIKRAAPAAKFYASAADGAIVAAGGRGDPFLKGQRFYYEPVKPDVTL